MMKPHIYFEIDFLNKIDSFIIDKRYDENPELKNFLELKSLFSISSLYCNAPDDIISEIILKSRKSTANMNFFEYIISSFSEQYKGDILDFTLSRTVFFLNKDQKEIEQIIQKNNVICFGRDYSFHEKINKLPQRLILSEKMEGLNLLSHRTKNIIIQDPYLFEDAIGKEKKMPNIIKFLKSLYIDNEECICHLSILTLDQENEIKINSRISELNKINKNLKISVLLHEKKDFGQQRCIITDYYVMDIQHIFDREGNVNPNFVFLKESNFAKNIKEIIEVAKKTKDKIGLYKKKWGDILENPILK